MAQRLNGVDWTNLEDDYKRLGSLRAVAQLYGCSKNSVHKRLMQSITPMNKAGRQPQSRSYKAILPPEQWPTAVKFLVAMAKAKGHSLVTGQRSNFNFAELREAVQSM